MTRTTESVLSHVLTERNIQRERYSLGHDDAHAPETWDDLIAMYAAKAAIGDDRRYVRLVQVAAIAVAAAEQEPVR